MTGQYLLTPSTLRAFDESHDERGFFNREHSVLVDPMHVQLSDRLTARLDKVRQPTDDRRCQVTLLKGGRLGCSHAISSASGSDSLLEYASRVLVRTSSHLFPSVRTQAARVEQVASLRDRRGQLFIRSALGD